MMGFGQDKESQFSSLHRIGRIVLQKIVTYLPMENHRK